MDYDTTIDAEGRVTAVPDVESGDAIADNDLFEADRKRKRRLILAAAAVLIAALAAIAVSMRGGPEPTTAAVDQIPTISVVVPGARTLQGAVKASGSLAARRPMPVGSVGDGGEVRQVLVDAGDWVRAGQVLAIVDRSVQSQQVIGQEAQVRVARADAELAEANLRRALKLVDRGFISKADVDRLTATRDAAAARVRVADAQLAEMRARTARLNITAPAGGLVLERNVDQGQVVGAGGGPLFVLARGGEMELAALVNETDLSRLSVGRTALVTPVGSDRAFAGEVWQLSPTVNQSTRQGTVRIALSYDRALRPGGFASTTIAAGKIRAPVLPDTAIMTDEQGSFVYILGKDNKVKRRTVTTGMVMAHGVAIVEGLTGNERVVLRAGAFLHDGDPVHPRLAEPKS